MKWDHFASINGGRHFTSWRSLSLLPLHHLWPWSRLDSKWEEERKRTIIDLLCQSLNRFLLKQKKACLTGLENMNLYNIMYCPLCNSFTLGDCYSIRQKNIIPSSLNYKSQRLYYTKKSLGDGKSWSLCLTYAGDISLLAQHLINFCTAGFLPLPNSQLVAEASQYWMQKKLKAVDQNLE